MVVVVVAVPQHRRLQIRSLLHRPSGRSKRHGSQVRSKAPSVVRADGLAHETRSLDVTVMRSAGTVVPVSPESPESSVSAESLVSAESRPLSVSSDPDVDSPGSAAEEGDVVFGPSCRPHREAPRLPHVYRAWSTTLLQTTQRRALYPSHARLARPMARERIHRSLSW